MREDLKQFLKTEAFSSILLLFSALIAIIWANSPFEFWHKKFVESSLFWINEGLMSIFFLLVGLEIKREFFSSELDQSQILLPLVAALGGMMIPAVIYSLINLGDPITMRAWATPVATDIAFSFGVLMLFGQRVPYNLKLFLLALAIFDDIGAIIIIALFYTQSFTLIWFFVSCIIFLLLYFLNRAEVQSVSFYLALGICLWFTLFKSGIHPTIAGILLAFTIPDKKENGLLTKLETQLHPCVAYIIMPLFALANAGVSLHRISISLLTSKIVLGIAFGLFIGKQIGIFGFTLALVKSGFAKLPSGSSWFSLYALSILCGIGFTMSLFLGTLSFQNQNIFLEEVRLGVIIGSVISGIVGTLLLKIAFAKLNQL